MLGGLQNTSMTSRDYPSGSGDLSPVMVDPSPGNKQGTGGEPYGRDDESDCSLMGDVDSDEEGSDSKEELIAWIRGLQNKVNLIKSEHLIKHSRCGLSSNPF